MRRVAIGGARSGDTEQESLAVRSARLFVAYREGDEGTMVDLVRLLTPLLWHTARSARLDAASAEDVVQNVWLALVRHADSISEPMAVLQWLVVSTRRESWRFSRAAARVHPEDLDDLEPSGPAPGAAAAGPSVEDEVVGHDSDSRLWRHIAGLPDRCRALLRVIAFADRPDYAQLAQALGMPQGSIGPTRGRCLAKLRLALSADPTWET